MSQLIAREKALEALSVAQQALAEERYDTAVDRAYFAMFHAARSALQAVGGIEIASLTSHKSVLVSFSELLVKPGLVDVRFGKMVNAIQRLRHVSDYSDRHVSQQEAIESVEAALEFCGVVLSLPSPTRGAS
jgi:uncharacterized protein (UPF0332 family)